MSDKRGQKSDLTDQIDELKQENTILRRDMEELKREMERYRQELQMMRKGASRSDAPPTKKQPSSKPSSTRASLTTSWPNSIATPQTNSSLYSNFSSKTSYKLNSNLASPPTSKPTSNLPSPINSRLNSNDPSPTTSRPTSKNDLLSPVSSQNLSTIREHLSATLSPNVTPSPVRHHSNGKSPSRKPASQQVKMCNCNYAITQGVECGCSKCYRGSIGTPCTPNPPNTTLWRPPLQLLDSAKNKSQPHPSILTSQKEPEAPRKASTDFGRIHWEDGGNMPGSPDALDTPSPGCPFYKANITSDTLGNTASQGQSYNDANITSGTLGNTASPGRSYNDANITSDTIGNTASPRRSYSVGNIISDTIGNTASYIALNSTSSTYGNTVSPESNYNTVNTTYINEGLRRHTVSEPAFVAERKKRKSEDDIGNDAEASEYYPAIVVDKQMFLKSSAPYKSNAPDLGLTRAPPLVEKLSVKDIIEGSDPNTARVIREFLGMGNPAISPESPRNDAGKDGFLVIGDETGPKTFITKKQGSSSSPCVCGSQSRQVDSRGAHDMKNSGVCVCGGSKSKIDVGSVIAPRSGLSSSDIGVCGCQGSITLPTSRNDPTDDVAVHSDGQSDRDGKDLVIKISQDRDNSKEIQLRIDKGLGKNGKGISVKIDPETAGSKNTIVIRICNNEDNLTK